MDVIDVLSIVFLLALFAIPFIMYRLDDPVRLFMLVIVAFFGIWFAYVQGARYSAGTPFAWDDRLWTAFIVFGLVDIMLVIIKMIMVVGEKTMKYIAEGV